ncbi:putative RNA-binding protein Luc7-like 2 [Trichinella spiralis]|uniref:Putative RNA-binding protein Luc7-like 2 n=1 Tax=Trichinella spiralis TaxID=6334 RepID=A0A0V1C1H1_TRISP|nr:putative RNA-binding protein Luc7-like 2 [Trichinella spiralis]
MTASEQMRKMLDELMGTSRDGDGGKNTLPFTDTRVCRSYLLNCCPHEVLANTRMDMGMCSRVHDPALRADYEKASTERDYFYDVDALDHLERFFRDCDRRMEGAKKRLAETQEELTEDLAEKGNKVLEFNEQIGITLAEAEKLGEEGKVEESLKLMEKVEELRKLKQEADSVFRSSMPPSSYQQQKLRVCEVCSAYLGIHDNDRRLADHFGGKLHMGFVFLREKYAALQKMVKDRRAERCNSDRRNNDRSYHDYRSSSNYTNRDRDSRRSRSRSRDHRSIDGQRLFGYVFFWMHSSLSKYIFAGLVLLQAEHWIGWLRDRGSRFYDECRSSSHRSRCSRSRSNDRNRGSRRSNEERSRSRDYKSRKHE